MIDLNFANIEGKPILISLVLYLEGWNYGPQLYRQNLCHWPHVVQSAILEAAVL